MNEEAVRLDQEALEEMRREMLSQKIPPQKKPVQEMTWEEKHNRVLTSLISTRALNKDLQRLNECYKKQIGSLQEKLKGIEGGDGTSEPDQKLAARARRSKSEARKLRELARDIHAIVNGFKGRTEIRMELRDEVWMKYAVVMNMGTFVQCCHCGKLLKQSQFSVDHLKPLALGGTDDMENLRPSCMRCNWDRPLEDISHRFFTTGSDQDEKTED